MTMSIDPKQHAEWLRKHGQLTVGGIVNPTPPRSGDIYRPMDAHAIKPPSSSGYNPQVVIAWFLECKLPAPFFEWRFHALRNWKFDLAWVPQKVAVEVQGGLHIGGGHTRGAQIEREHQKYNAAACLGWRILYCQPDGLCTVAFAAEVRQALEWRQQ